MYELPIQILQKNDQGDYSELGTVSRGGNLDADSEQVNVIFSKLEETIKPFAIAWRPNW